MNNSFVNIKIMFYKEKILNLKTSQQETISKLHEYVS